MRLGFQGEPAGAWGFDPAKIKESRPISSNGQRLPSGFWAESGPNRRFGPRARKWLLGRARPGRGASCHWLLDRA